MKQFIICLVVLVVFLCSCTNDVKQNNISSSDSMSVSSVSNNTSENNLANDYTVDIKPLDLSKYNTDKNKMERALLQGDYAYYISDIESLYKQSTHLIRCEVKDVEFVSKDGMAYTNLDVKILESYKGKLNQNDLITVITNGGYVVKYDNLKFSGLDKQMTSVKLKESKTKLIEFFNDEPYPQIGEEYILGLTDESTGRVYPYKSCYYIIAGSNSMYKLDGNNKYTRNLETSKENKTYKNENSDDSFELNYFKDKLKAVK